MKLKMARNRHIVPLITNCLIILCIGMQPLFSSFLYLQQPPSDFVKPISNISVIEELGVQNPQPFLFTDAAAAFMQTSCKIGPAAYLQDTDAIDMSSTLRCVAAAIYPVPPRCGVDIDADCMLCLLPSRLCVSHTVPPRLSKLCSRMARSKPIQCVCVPWCPVR